MIGRFLLRIFLAFMLLILFSHMVMANIFMWGYIDFIPALILNLISFSIIIYSSIIYIMSWIPRKKDKS